MLLLGLALFSDLQLLIRLAHSVQSWPAQSGALPTRLKQVLHHAAWCNVKLS
jgi:hypothetical protein